MYATAQTGSVRPAHHLVIDLGTEAYRVPIMRYALPKEIITVLPSYHARGDPGPRPATQDSVRIQGGNWSMQGFRRSGHVHDEDECQMSIAEFMAEQGLPPDGDDA